MAHPTPPPVMKGGVRDILIDFSKKQSSHVELLFILLLVLGIVFPSSFSNEIVNNLSTLPGRVLLFATLVAILHYTSWTYGLLFALLTGILLATRSVKEGFMSEYTFQSVIDKKKWFVEEVLHETPVGIKEDRVTTAAVQDYEENSKYQDTKSSSR
jgi:hypothetical protein